jgi:hypothetical protein
MYTNKPFVGLDRLGSSNSAQNNKKQNDANIVDEDMKENITTQDKVAFAKIERAKANNAEEGAVLERPSVHASESTKTEGATSSSYIETIFKQNLYHDGQKQNKASDVHKPLRNYSDFGPVVTKHEKTTSVNKEVKERIKEPYEHKKRREEFSKESDKKQNYLYNSYDEFKDKPHGFDKLESAESETAFDEYKKNYDVALSKLNANSDGSILNQSKNRKDISDITKIRNTGVAPMVNNREGYEDKFDHRSQKLENVTLKKRLPYYDGSQEGRVDKYNALSVLSDDGKSRLPSDLAHLDFVPLYFHDLVNKKFIPFRCYLKSLDDQNDANWTTVNYLGRADGVGVYTGFTRSVTLSFETVTTALEELHPMWQRINYLVGLTRPADYTNSEFENSKSPTEQQKVSSFIVPPLVKFNMGDLYVEQPVLITSVAVAVPDGNWELGNNESDRTHQYNYANGSIKREGRTAIYPKSCELTVSMTLLEKNIPKTQQRHFGHHFEDGQATYSVPQSKKSKFDPNKGFNDQLIWYEENDTQQSKLEERDVIDEDTNTDVNSRQQDRVNSAKNSDNNRPRNILKNATQAINSVTEQPTPTPKQDEDTETALVFKMCTGDDSFANIIVRVADDKQLATEFRSGDVVKLVQASGRKSDYCYEFISHIEGVKANQISENDSTFMSIVEGGVLGHGITDFEIRVGSPSNKISVSQSASIVYNSCDDCMSSGGKSPFDITIPRITGGV